jgi:hypothetical protein
MNQVTLADIQTLAEQTNGELQRLAAQLGRDVAIYLHWSAGHYQTQFDDYHINIGPGGEIYIDGDLSDSKNHTWHRNTGAIGIALDCCYEGSPDNLGPEPPTDSQIEAMARVIAVLSGALGLTIDGSHVMTHAEAANIDGYGPDQTWERWDLWKLSSDGARDSGGDILRGKAIWYQQNGVEE